MQRDKFNPNQIITTRDFPVHSAEVLQQYFNIYKEGRSEELPPVPLVSIEICLSYFDEPTKIILEEYLSSHPEVKYFLLNGSHRTTAANLNNQLIDGLVIEQIEDIEQLRQIGFKGEVYEHLLEDTLEENIRELVEHFKGTDKFETVQEKTDRMIREGTIPESLVLDKSRHLPLEEQVKKVVFIVFKEEPKEIFKVTTGICNEVFKVALSNKEVIIRLNKDDQYIKASEKYIPLFQSRGIKVPQILASDYSQTEVPYSYQVLSLVEGEDLGKVIESLSDEQLKGVANSVSDIFKKLADIPTNGQFGFIYGPGSEKDLVGSWPEWMAKSIKESTEAGQKTGVLDKEIIGLVNKVFTQYKSDFDKVESKFYYDDISSKNVMIYQGAFSGLVDIDGGAYGDYREALGRIKASWPGTHYGEFYLQAIMDKMDLNNRDRELITAYALIHRFHWLCEAGVQFNQNTSSEINWDEVKEGKIIIKELAEELKN